MPKSSAAPTTPVRRAAPPPLLSHIHSSPTLRHPHASTLPAPFSERARARTLPRSFRASTWEEVKRREDRVDRARADGRRARGRELVRDLEWGVMVGVQDAEKPRARSLSARPGVEAEPRRISLGLQGFRNSLSPVLPSVPPSPAFTTLVQSSPVFSAFIASPRSFQDLSDLSPNTTPRGLPPRRPPPPSRYSVPSCPPSPETNFSRPMVMGVPRIESPPNQAGIGSSPMRTPKASRFKVIGPRKRSTLGDAMHTNLPTSTSLPQVLFPAQKSPTKKTPLSLRIAGTSGPKDASVSRSSRRRLQSLFTSSPTPSSANSTPTPRNPYPTLNLNHSLLHSCVSLSLSSPTLSSLDPASISSRARSQTTTTRARPEVTPSIDSSEAVDTPTRPFRVRATTTLGRSSGRTKAVAAVAERRSPVLEGLEDVMRMAQEVMHEME